MARRPTVVGPALGEENPFDATLADYAHNLLSGTALRRLDRVQLARLESIDLVVEMARAAGTAKTRTASGDDELSGDRFRRRLRSHLRQHGSVPRAPAPPTSPLRENLELIAQLVGLDPVQQDLLQFLVVLHCSRELSEMADSFGSVTMAGAGALIAAGIGMPLEKVLAALDPGGRLVGSGLIEVQDHFGCDLTDKLGLKKGVADAALTPGLDRRQFLARFLPEARPPTLDWSDFQHQTEPAGIARALLEGALRQRTAGVNILLYGATGTGKTELARLLASALGVKLHIAGGADDEGESPTAQERLSSLLLGQRLIRGERALLLFDELEDLFRWESRGLFGRRHAGNGQMSKQWFNALLETNPVPTIWITNNVEGIDPAFLRRFAFAMEFRPIGARQRARVLARHLGEESDVDAAELEAIAQRFEVSPAQLGNAVAAARLLAPDGRPDRAGVEKVLGPVDKLVSGVDSSRRPVFDAARYRIDALNSAEDLPGIVERLATWKPGTGPGLSMCLYGPPGTGKSELVKYLAHRMGRPVLYRRVSDIQSMWVGQTEKHIAQAFRDAEENDAVLLFDEADSFLRDRRSARNSWEVTQVNEFLQQLETFRGVVACTTNLWRDLDAASLRRFVFKLELRYLTAEQTMTLFGSTFAGLLEAPLTAGDEASVRQALGRIGRLTPGDFAAVERREQAMGRRSRPDALVEALAAEVRAKGEDGARAIGF